MAIANPGTSGITEKLESIYFKEKAKEKKEPEYLQVSQEDVCCEYQYNIKLSDKKFIAFLSLRPLTAIEQGKVKVLINFIKTEDVSTDDIKNSRLAEDKFLEFYSVTHFCISTLDKWASNFKNEVSPYESYLPKVLCQAKKHLPVVENYIDAEFGLEPKNNELIKKELRDFFFGYDVKKVLDNMTSFRHVFNKTADKIRDPGLRARHLLFLISALDVLTEKIAASGSVDANRKRVTAELFANVLSYLTSGTFRESKSLFEFKQLLGMEEVTHIDDEGTSHLNYNGCSTLILFVQYIELVKIFLLMEFFHSEQFLKEFKDIITACFPGFKLLGLNSSCGLFSSLLEKNGLKVAALVSEKKLKTLKNLNKMLEKVKYLTAEKLEKMFRQYGGEISGHSKQKVLYLVEFVEDGIELCYDAFYILMNQTVPVLVIFFGEVLTLFRTNPHICKILEFSVKHFPRNFSFEKMYLVAFNYSDELWRETIKTIPQRQGNLAR